MTDGYTTFDELPIGLKVIIVGLAISTVIYIVGGFILIILYSVNW